MSANIKQLELNLSRQGDRFVIGCNDGSVAVYAHYQKLATKKLKGFSVMVAVLNNRVVAAAMQGKLSVLDENLEVLKIFGDVDKQPMALHGNEEYLCLGDYRGNVYYYNVYHDKHPKVSLKFIFIFFQTLALLNFDS